MATRLPILERQSSAILKSVILFIGRSSFQNVITNVVRSNSVGNSLALHRTPLSPQTQTHKERSAFNPHSDPSHLTKIAAIIG